MSDTDPVQKMATPTPTSPWTTAQAITPNNDDDLEPWSKGLYVGTGGDVAVMMANGSTVTFPNVQSGSILPIVVRRVLVTGTDASDIVGGY